MMTQDPTLRDRLDDYLVMRRSLGFQLNDIERQVGLFCTWLVARGQTQTFSLDEAVTWARLNPDAHPSWWATRLSLVRRFAAYLNANGIEVPVIPSGLLPARKPRAVPFIYSQEGGFKLSLQHPVIDRVQTTAYRVPQQVSPTPNVCVVDH
ncbi:hypothetical protein [Brevibacterium spongiae]|uniref:Core-binding (CB) domain-containing protein n=1 Tax=Brevibacterium spongiae TaxID=2909672 RepID=A0ABY5SPD8_9MICO|nr:hypothetical protein [Brevibacterium spongiae]UVI36420.1 hypothetical protein L1F31_01770 [Brevibacterium spongiae]